MTTDKIVNKKINDKEYSKFNIIIISVFILLYILLANKITDILTNYICIENEKLESYIMYIYFIGIMSIVIAYFFIEDIERNKGNYIINRGLIYSGVILLLYTVFFYWEYLGDYSKLSLLITSIISIVYYAYQ
jgi:hypothetical protein